MACFKKWKVAVKIKNLFCALAPIALLTLAIPVDAQITRGDRGNNLFHGSVTGKTKFFGRKGEDQVNYEGSITAYGFELRRSGRVRVHKPHGKFDVLDNIERVGFGGRVYTLEEIFYPISSELNVVVFRGTRKLDIFNGIESGEAYYYGGKRHDRVYYEGYSSQYSFTGDGDGIISVVKPSGDVDRLNSIEAVRFLEEPRAKNILDLVADSIDDKPEETSPDEDEGDVTPPAAPEGSDTADPTVDPEMEVVPESDPMTDDGADIPSTPPSDPNQLFHYGQAVTLAGANLAWSDNSRFSSDFGAGDGFGNADTNLIGFQAKFDEISRNGGNSARIWLHTTAQISPHIDPNGQTIALSRELSNQQVVDQMREVLDSAWDRGVLVTFSLFSFDMLCDHYQNDFGYTGSMLRNRIALTSGRQDYFDNALTPIVNGLKDHPALFAYEILNEPEGAYPDRQFCDTSFPITQVDAALFVNEAAALIHGLDANVKVTTSTHTDLFADFTNETLTSLDGANPDGILDFYELHWYEGWGRDPFTTPKADYNLDKPIIIGEFATYQALGTSSNPSEDAISAILSNGYAGAWPWSLATTDNPTAIGATINKAQQPPIDKTAIEICIRDQSPDCYKQ